MRLDERGAPPSVRAGGPAARAQTRCRSRSCRRADPAHAASLNGQPAYVTGRWGILAWNRAGAAVFGDYARLEGSARNITHLMSGNLAHREMLADWPSLAAAALAMFRADSAPYRGDPDFERLISPLAAASGEFWEGWPPPGDRRSSFGQQAHRSSGRRTYSFRTYEFRRFRHRGAAPCGLYARRGGRDGAETRGPHP